MYTIQYVLSIHYVYFEPLNHTFCILNTNCIILYIMYIDYFYSLYIQKAQPARFSYWLLYQYILYILVHSCNNYCTPCKWVHPTYFKIIKIIFKNNFVYSLLGWSEHLILLNILLKICYISVSCSFSPYTTGVNVCCLLKIGWIFS